MMLLDANNKTITLLGGNRGEGGYLTVMTMVKGVK